MRPVGCVLALAALAGCKLPLPYTLEMLGEDAQKRPEKALVHYLSQGPPVDAGACRPDGQGPLPAPDPPLVDAITRAFVKGRVPAENWRGCVAALWAGGDDVLRDQVAASVLESFDPLLVARPRDAADPLAPLRVVVEVVETRPEDAHLPAALALSTVERVQGRVPELDGDRGALVRRFLDAVSIDLGLWRGERVTAERIATEEDEALLIRFARRLPDPDLRLASRERVVRRRIAASPYPVVRQEEEAVVRAVLAEGHWSLDPDRFPIAEAGLRPDAPEPEALVVAQDPLRGWAGLLARGADGGASPRVGVDGLLAIRVAGVSLPVTLCAGSDGLDPTPCVSPAQASLDHPLAVLEGATMVLQSGLDEATVRRLAGDTRMVLPLAVGPSTIRLDWPLTFAVPEPVVHVPGEPSARGPDLVVRVSHQEPGRLLYEVEGPEIDEVVVIERSDLARFAVVSQGGAGLPGKPGEDGANGKPGRDGRDALCPEGDDAVGTRGENGWPGQAGEDGEDGGPGGPGGDGGDITVVLGCAFPQECAPLLEAVDATVRSAGGPGGEGGPGGAGGAGGPGGAGGATATCQMMGGQATVELGGNRGPDGIMGSPGAKGADGPDGKPGRIDVSVVPPQ